jgi:hypothetical protein
MLQGAAKFLAAASIKFVPDRIHDKPAAVLL